mmetsp:Transcript_99083/g.296059  ORF Transcript_99083/g.296059 Transcript_99083/m.296059 type:complete len:229 (+) Transcript_99083:708-1394(+)
MPQGNGHEEDQQEAPVEEPYEKAAHVAEADALRSEVAVVVHPGAAEAALPAVVRQGGLPTPAQTAEALLGAEAPVEADPSGVEESGQVARKLRGLAAGLRCAPRGAAGPVADNPKPAELEQREEDQADRAHGRHRRSLGRLQLRVRDTVAKRQRQGVEAQATEVAPAPPEDVRPARVLALVLRVVGLSGPAGRHCAHSVQARLAEFRLSHGPGGETPLGQRWRAGTPA